ncbi:GNAT family N-acetyltransferase [Thalassospira mesophila]|uniref:N-acetyltransferase domain-containing protein n=1 Tax=Thalassospira mesophila TaxID=1293891 RepID=A0A1Y2L5J4_9PROT|nr:GNAT family N-acetyltransferase [Thalassospira mesophila]OSQ40830.1 hypothetical protein TMES_03950 [Thalassospira mesophila]
MPNLPAFETARLRLRPRTGADFAACLAMDREPGMTRYIAGPWADDTAHRAFLHDRIGRDYGDGLGYWSVFPKTAAKWFAGWVLLIPENGVGPDIEIGWRFVLAAQGKGYATEAAHAVLNHAFATLAIDRVVADIDRRNLPSIKVAQKIGLHCESRGENADLYAVSRNNRK